MESSSAAQEDPMASSVGPDWTTATDEAVSLLKQISDLEQRIKQIETGHGPAAIASFPPSIRAKVRALRKLQLEIIDKEVKFHHMAHKMEVAFQEQFNECNETISRIVNGLEVPEVLLADSDGTANDVADQPKGVPEFWLTVLKASCMGVLVQEADQPALKALQNIRCVLQNEPEPAFVLEFHFASNDYFSNEVLTKNYFLRCAANPDAPAKFNGFEIYHCTGCTIDWKPGHNLEKTNEARECESQHATKSFFNFFSPEMRTGDSFDPEYNVAVQECDFHYGYYIKETVIPRAVFLFLGEDLNSTDNSSSCYCDLCLYSEEHDASNPTPNEENEASSHQDEYIETAPEQPATAEKEDL